jgi:hypothetical protein
MAKLRKSSSRKRASRIFTDRDQPQNLFRKALHSKIKNPTTPSPSLVFYGVGGVGKSRLRKELTTKYCQTNEKIVYADADFSRSELTSPGRFILEVSNVYETQGVKFPHFKLAYGIFFAKKNPDIQFNEQSLPFLDQTGMVGAVVAAFNGMGLAGAVKDVVQQSYQLYHKKFALSPEVKDSLNELDDCTLEEIEDSLMTFFLYDLEIFSEKKESIPVLLLDTFEGFINHNSGVHQQDFWLRELIEHFDFGLAVIFSRDKIAWASQDSSWTEKFDQHLMQNLSQNDTCYFLEHCSITNTATQQQIYTACQGHPFHLDLCVDAYLEQGNHPTNFGQNKKEVIDRFIAHLKEEEVNILKLLSVPRYYTEELFDTLLQDFNFSHLLDIDEKILRFSFIEQRGHQTYLHSLMRKHLLADLSPKLLDKTHNVILDFYHSKLKEIQLSHSHLNLQPILSEAYYHAQKRYPKTQLTTWLERNDVKNVFTLLAKKGTAKFLLRLFQSITQSIPITSLDTEYLDIMIDMRHLAGDYIGATKTIETILSHYKPSEIEASQVLIRLSIRKIHHQMFYQPVNPLLQEAFLLYDNNRHSNLSREIEFMIGGNLGVLSGEYTLCRKWLRKAIVSCKSSQDKPLLSRVIRKYAEIVKIAGHTTFAERIFKYGISLSKGFDRYELYLRCCLADLYVITRQLDLAKIEVEKSLQKARNLHIQGWIAHCYLVKARIAMLEQQFELCKKHLNHSYKIYKKINQMWGIINTQLIHEILRLKTKQPIRVDILQELLRCSKQFNYQHEQLQIQQLLSGKYTMKPLMFL